MRFWLVLCIVFGPVVAWAASPTVSTPTTCTGSESSCITNNSSAVTSHVMTWPACASGKMIVMFTVFDNAPAVTWPNNSNDSTTSILADTVPTTTCHARYRRTNGTEPSTITITTDTSQRSVMHAYCVTGAHASSNPETTTSFTGSSATTFSPPTVTPSWGSDDVLAFTTLCLNSSVPNISGTPGSYTNTDTSDGSGRLESAYLGITGTSSINPGDYTTDAAGNGISQTVIVRGSAQAPRSMYLKRQRSEQ